MSIVNTVVCLRLRGETDRRRRSGRRAGCSVRAIGFFVLSTIAIASAASAASSDLVGPRDSGRAALPVNQVIAPAGRQVALPGLRPQALALSPDGRLLVTAGKTHELVVVDPVTAEIRQRVPLPSEEVGGPAPDDVSPNILKPDQRGQLSYTGLIFSPDGRRIYLSNVDGSVKVFRVAEDGTVSGWYSMPLPLADAPRREVDIPAGLAVSADGQTLYVALNLSNRVGEFVAATGELKRVFDVGVAPFDVALVGRKLYASNWGGRRPQPGDLTGPAGRGMEVRVDPIHHIASEGSVSVIDLSEGQVTGEILTQLHASALAVSPDARYVVCANAASDNLSVIDTHADRVVETIWVKPSPADLFGASPNALAFDPNGATLYIANGTQNAVAVVQFDPGDRESTLVGLIPVGWFPGALVLDAARHSLYVANIKGLPSQPRRDSDSGREGFNSHHYHGSLSLLAIPDPAALQGQTAAVWENYQRERMADALLPPRGGQPLRPVPERIGEPSVFEHVVYVIKENRTYDQVLGALGKGNGDPTLCIFGESVTPNQHKLVQEFVLLDNAYCCGILSADGHQWSTSAFATDYLERSFAGWPRSYPDGMGIDECDALAYAPSGFLWDNAARHGVSLWNFGEFAMPTCGWSDPDRDGEPEWRDYWDEFQNGSGEVVIASRPSIESIRPYTPTDYVGWNMDVPDVWRARYITNQLAAWEREGKMPALILICLPNDHTSGTRAGAPTPAALVADNDLAFGQLVQAISHSRFWSNTVIFAIEDDPQAGWDHVSGYRTTAYVVSPYTKRGETISTQYNSTSVLRTIEQILGLPPMNQFDATATPLFDCFTGVPDYRPFTAVPNQVPLDEMNPPPNALTDPLLRRHAVASAELNLTRVDACPEDLFNRILWHSMKGSHAPYPEWAIATADDQE